MSCGRLEFCMGAAAGCSPLSQGGILYPMHVFLTYFYVFLLSFQFLR